MFSLKHFQSTKRFFRKLKAQDDSRSPNEETTEKFKQIAQQREKNLQSLCSGLTLEQAEIFVGGLLFIR